MAPPRSLHPALQCTVRTCTGEVAVDPLMLPAAAMFVVPVPVLVATPSWLMMATAVSDEVQFTCILRSCVEESLKVPVTVYCWVVPRAMFCAVAGVAMASELSVALVTVNPSEAKTPGKDAAMVVEPGATPAAHPGEPSALLTVATDGLVEAQVTEDEISWVDPSVRVAIAENCVAVPWAIVTAVGLTVAAVGPITNDVTFSTLIKAPCETVPNFAVTVAVPTEAPVTVPTAFTVTTGLEVDAVNHATSVVSGWVDPSLNLPTAVSCKVEPTAIPTGAVEEDVGVIVMLLRVAELTVRVWDAETAPRAALIVVVPAATPAAMPSGAEVVIVAAAVLLLLQFTSPVMSCTVLSLNVPIAV